MKKIELQRLNELCIEAKNLPRKRKNYNYHDDLSDTLQRLLNAMQPDTYVQPHKHESPDKREVFILLTGKALVVTFNNNGEIEEHFILSRELGNFGVEIPEKKWHTVIVLEEDTVVYEVKDGPYSPVDDKNFAEWAPKEGDPNCHVFNEKILDAIGYSG